MSRLINGEMSVDIFPDGISFTSILPLKDRNLILCDCINFKRILYGLQTIKNIQPILEKYSNKRIMSNLVRCEEMLYSAAI